MSYLIDTNVLSELRKGERCNPNVRRWFDRARVADLYISVIALGEIRKGVERIRRRDPPAAQTLEQWLNSIVEHYGNRIVAIDVAIADVWGRLNVPDPLPVIDGLLAATARVHGYTLVTRDVADTQRTGVPVLNPFES